MVAIKWAENSWHITTNNNWNIMYMFRPQSQISCHQDRVTPCWVWKMTSWFASQAIHKINTWQNPKTHALLTTNKLTHNMQTHHMKSNDVPIEHVLLWHMKRHVSFHQELPLNCQESNPAILVKSMAKCHPAYRSCDATTMSLIDILWIWWWPCHCATQDHQWSLVPDDAMCRRRSVAFWGSSVLPAPLVTCCAGWFDNVCILADTLCQKGRLAS